MPHDLSFLKATAVLVDESQFIVGMEWLEASTQGNETWLK